VHRVLGPKKEEKSENKIEVEGEVKKEVQPKPIDDIGENIL